MHSHYWNDIFRLFSMIILADNKVYKEEVDCFVDQIMALKEELDNSVALTRKMTLDWFFVHREEIKNDMDQLDAESRLNVLLTLLGDIDDKPALVRAMQKISASDGYEHSFETRLIRKAAKRWHIELNEQ